MRIEKVSYHELLPTGSYLNVRLGVDLIINEGEDAKAALQVAKELVNEFHKENFPHVYGQFPIVSSQDEPRPANQEEAIIQDIKTCKDLKMLESYKLIAKNHPKIQEAYNQKLNQLNQL